jgi:hypothetical protein
MEEELIFGGRDMGSASTRAIVETETCDCPDPFHPISNLAHPQGVYGDRMMTKREWVLIEWVKIRLGVA